MSRGGEIKLEWAGDERTFRLRIGELRELQEACDAGPLAICRRLATGDWRIEDVREPLRLGLIGGGLPMPDAVKLIQRYFDRYEIPMTDHAPVAWAIVMAAIQGTEDEPLAPAGEESPPGKAGAPGASG